MQDTRKRTLALGVGGLTMSAILAACGGTTDEAGPQGPSSGDVRHGGGRFSVAAQLAQLPSIETGGIVTISVADVAAVARANGLAVPQDASEVTPEWQQSVVGATPSSSAMLYPPALSSGQDLAAQAESLGFSWAQADTFASESAPPDEFAVLDAEAARADFGSGVTEWGDGVWTYGSGDDYAAAPAGDRSADRLGRPVRIARSDERVAVTLSTPMAEAWARGQGPRLSDDESLAAIAEQLDAAGVISATIVVGTPAAGAVGIGWHPDRRAVIVYDVGSDAVASAQAGPLEDRYAGELPGGQGSYSNLIEVAGVAAKGRTVVVDAGLPRSLTAPLDLLMTGALPAPEVA